MGDWGHVSALQRGRVYLFLKKAIHMRVWTVAAAVVASQLTRLVDLHLLRPL
jgi:hypothetical protein